MLTTALHRSAARGETGRMTAEMPMPVSPAEPLAERTYSIGIDLRFGQ